MSTREVLYVIPLMLVVFSVAGVATIVNSVFAQEQKFMAYLSGDQEIPFNNSSAKGWAWFKPMGDSVSYGINVTGIDKVTMAHIHSGKTGKNGDVVVVLFRSDSPTAPINGPLAEGNFATDFKGPMAGKTLSDLVTAMQKGEIYVNVHTEANPNGEIRGQIGMANATTISNSTITTR